MLLTVSSRVFLRYRNSTNTSLCLSLSSFSLFLFSSFFTVDNLLLVRKYLLFSNSLDSLCFNSHSFCMQGMKFLKLRMVSDSLFPKHLLFSWDYVCKEWFFGLCIGFHYHYNSISFLTSISFSVSRLKEMDTA